MGKVQQVLSPLVHWGTKENLTRNEICLIDTFTKLYVVALAERKQIQSMEELVKIIAENIQDTWELSMTFKYLRYPKTEMDRGEYISYTSALLLKKFEVKEINNATKLIYEMF